MMSKSRIAPWTQMSDQTQWNDLIAIPSTVPKALMLERRDTKLQMDGKSLTYGCISKSNLYLRIWWCKFLTAQEWTTLWAQFSYSDRFLTVLFSMDPTLEFVIVGFWILNWLSEYVYSLSNDELNKRIGEVTEADQSQHSLLFSSFHDQSKGHVLHRLFTSLLSQCVANQWCVNLRRRSHNYIHHLYCCFDFKKVPEI